MNQKKQMELYIHIPFCVRKCEYCDFLSGCYDEKVQADYVDALCREIAYQGSIKKAYEVDTIFIGGGTPSWLHESKMHQIMKCVYESFRVCEDAEISIECNPGTVTRDKFLEYKRIGINRISIGLQSANDDELKLLGRIHTYERFLHTYELARECHFTNINVDIMTGLPGQTLDKLYHTLQQVIRLKPEHISAYALIIEEGTPFYEKYKFDHVKQHAGMDTEFLPNEDDEYRLYKMTQKVLEENGYHQYEVSNYAKTGHACKHNIGYWKRKNYLGLGIGAASFIEEVRYKNISDIYEYMEQTKMLSFMTKTASEENPIYEEVTHLTRKDAMEEFMFLGLRMNEGVSRQDFLDYFKVPLDGIYGLVIEHLKQEELLISKEGRVMLTEKGSDLSNYALSQFLLDE